MHDKTQHKSTTAVAGKNIAILGGGPGGLTLARLLQQSQDWLLFHSPFHRFIVRLRPGSMPSRGAFACSSKDPM
jgi:cation diffusion facilitator CzcD-associated flavoprotein CzcO